MISESEVFSPGRGEGKSEVYELSPKGEKIIKGGHKFFLAEDRYESLTEDQN